MDLRKMLHILSADTTRLLILFLQVKPKTRAMFHFYRSIKISIFLVKINTLFFFYLFTLNETCFVCILDKLKIYWCLQFLYSNYLFYFCFTDWSMMWRDSLVVIATILLIGLKFSGNYEVMRKYWFGKLWNLICKWFIM
jgi:hypothetical protein